MKKKINVLITSDNIDNTTNGLISNVKRGYAFNYLIPNQYAEIPTKKRLKHIKMFRDIEKKQIMVQETKIKVLQERVKKMEKISIYRKIGDNYLIFGSIGEKDIKKWINYNTNIKLQKNKVTINENRSAGHAEIFIEIKQDQNIKLKVNIIPINI
uniref:50S ribosomal protein L9, chloroplastic n=1 Tax=Polysiphonia sertularioides TaxID=945028 RepID=A0A1Z1MGG6_9FLOR|nr:ribosomal protein L9 [Polysiphonia sertularioides]